MTQVRSDWNVRDHVALADFVVQSHRGAGVLAAENSLEAFELGWTLGCVPEADVRVDSRGQIVAAHDDPPADAPTIAQVFEVMRSDHRRRLYLDFKDVDVVQLAAMAREANVSGRVVFAATDYALIRRWREFVPDGQTLLWLGGTEAKIEERFRELRDSNFVGITQLQIHTHVIDDRSATFAESDRFLIDKGNEVRSRGILLQTLPYGGSAKQVYWKLMDLGFMSFATDHPQVTWDAVKAYYAEGK